MHRSLVLCFVQQLCVYMDLSTVLLHSAAQLSHDYYMKLVPTIYQPLKGGELSGYQYTFAYKVITMVCVLLECFVIYIAHEYNIAYKDVLNSPSPPHLC